MKKLFCTLAAAFAVLGVAWADNQSLSDVAGQYQKAVLNNDFAALRLLVSPESLALLNQLEKQSQGSDKQIFLQENDGRAIAETPILLTANQLIAGNKFYLRKIDGQWRVELPGAVDPTLYRNINAATTCTANLKQLGLGLMMFDWDHKMLPAEDGAAGLEQVRSTGYLNKPDVFVCPADENRVIAMPKTPISEKTCSYVYFGGLDLKKIRSPGRMPLAFDKPGISHERVTGVLFIDGHVEKFPGEFKSVTELIEALIARGGLDQQADFLRQKAKATDERLQQK